MSKDTKWTHTATLARAYTIGAEQFAHWAENTVKPGEVVELLQDPKLQSGDYITIRRGHSTGVVALADLRNVTAVK